MVFQFLEYATNELIKGKGEEEGCGVVCWVTVYNFNLLHGDTYNMLQSSVDKTVETF